MKRSYTGQRYLSSKANGAFGKCLQTLPHRREKLDDLLLFAKPRIYSTHEPPPYLLHMLQLLHRHLVGLPYRPRDHLLWYEASSVGNGLTRSGRS